MLGIMGGNCPGATVPVGAGTEVVVEGGDVVVVEGTLEVGGMVVDVPVGRTT